MSHVSTPRRPAVILRPACRRDVREFLRIGVQKDFWTTLQLDSGACVVAEIRGKVVGFLRYQVSPPGQRAWETIQKLLYWHWPWNAGAGSAPRRIGLLSIVVAAEWRRRGIGRALLDQLHHRFRRADDRFQAVVPETNLPVQLFLRDAGYRATRILSGAPDGEDRYLMERPG